MDAFIPASIGGILGAYRVTGSAGAVPFRSDSPINVPIGSVLAMISYSADTGSNGGGSQYNVWICEGGSAAIVSGVYKSDAVVQWHSGANQITGTASSDISVSVLFFG